MNRRRNRALIAFTLAVVLVDAGLVALFVALSRSRRDALWLGAALLLVGHVGMRITHRDAYGKAGG